MKKLIVILMALIMSAQLPITANSQEAVCYADDLSTYGAVETTTETEVIPYATKTDTFYNIPSGVPKYSDGSGKQYICAVLAGANIVGFYDRLYPSLIPDFEPARTIGSKVIWVNENPKIQDTINSLYSLMGTTSQGFGTTFQGYKNGLSSYFSSHGKSISFSEHSVSNACANCETAFRSGKPMAIFMSGFNMVSTMNFIENTGNDTLDINYYSGNHVSVAYGVRQIKYYNSNGSLIKTINLIRVSSGFDSMPFAYLYLEKSISIQHIVSMNIS